MDLDGPALVIAMARRGVPLSDDHPELVRGAIPAAPALLTASPFVGTAESLSENQS